MKHCGRQYEANYGEWQARGIIVSSKVDFIFLQFHIGDIDIDSIRLVWHMRHETRNINKVQLWCGFTFFLLLLLLIHRMSAWVFFFCSSENHFENAAFAHFAQFFFVRSRRTFIVFDLSRCRAKRWHLSGTKQVARERVREETTELQSHSESSYRRHIDINDNDNDEDDTGIAFQIIYWKSFLFSKYFCLVRCFQSNSSNVACVFDVRSCSIKRCEMETLPKECELMIEP